MKSVNICAILKRLFKATETDKEEGTCEHDDERRQEDRQDNRQSHHEEELHQLINFFFERKNRIK